MVALALTGNVFSAIATYPHTLSYFNEIVGGPLNGHYHLLDGNIDWGQDLSELERWSEAHRNALSLGVACSEAVNPVVFGFARLSFDVDRLADDTMDLPANSRPTSPALSSFALGLNELFDYTHFGDGHTRYPNVRCLQPAGRAGYSIRVFNVASNATSAQQRESQP